MGKISNRLIKLFEKEVSKIVVNLEDVRKGKEIAKKNTDVIKSIESLVKEHGNLDLAIYYNLQNLVSVIIEGLIMLKPMDSFHRFYIKVEDLYQPGFPPISPITGSYFNFWTTFDVPFGDDNETMGTCIYDIADMMRMDEVQKRALKNFCDSRMGIYEVIEANGLIYKLREIITDIDYEVHINSGYVGKKGDLILMRILPPMMVDPLFLAITTPYQLEGYTNQEWLDYFSRQNIRKGEIGYEMRFHDHLKFGKEKMYWSEFIFWSYLQHRTDVIYLTGIPDRVSTQPHHDKFSAWETYNKAMMRVKPLLKIPPKSTALNQDQLHP